MTDQTATDYRDMGRGILIPAHYTPEQARAFLARVGDERVVRTIDWNGERKTVLAASRSMQVNEMTGETGD